MLKIKVVSVKINLELLTNEFASFDCGENLSGVIHSPSENGPYTVFLDGGYLLGKFHNENEAVKNISFLRMQIEDAREVSGMDYPAYKRTFSEGANSRVH
ncbi:hypothetical protein QD840_002057 [Citrobacter koseri]|nr:DNA breaking-rejoining protein [Citrobacter koseri]